MTRNIDAKVLRRATLRAGLMTSVCMATFIAGGQAYAQTAPASQGAAVEEVVVTGSRIIREGYESPTPLSVVDTAALEAAPTGNIADFVNTMPVFQGSSSPQSSSGSVANGGQGINGLNLRGLGTNRTLVLLDGQRSVQALLTGEVDLNNFPQQLVSRVEAVTGGASAVYGSDAIGGVVNFILDKTYTGLKAEASGGLTDYADNRNWDVKVTGGFGFGGDRGHVLLSGEVYANDGIFFGCGTPERTWCQQGWMTFLTPGYSAATGAGGLPEYTVYKHVGTANAMPGGIFLSGPLKGVTFGPGGVYHQFQYGPLTNATMTAGSPEWVDIRPTDGASLAPREARQNAFFRAAYDVTDNINVFTQLSWNHAKEITLANIQYQGSSITIQYDNAFLPAALKALVPAGTKATAGNFGSGNFDLPRHDGTANRYVYRYVVGAEGKFDVFSTAWTWSTYYQKGMSRNSLRGNHESSKIRLAQASDAVVDSATGRIVCRINSTQDAAGKANDDPNCTPYNYFGIGVNDAGVYKWLVGDSQLIQTITQDVEAGTVTGEPISLWAGPVSIAVSAEHRREGTYGVTDTPAGPGLGAINDDWTNANFKASTGHFEVTEGALETLVPLAKGYSWADSLDVTGAVRFTDYSTSGFVTTWKVGSTYSPIPDVKFRATRSRDIRAPNLNELFQGGTINITPFVDPFPNSLNSAPLGTQAVVGNRNLKPETANTTGLGVVLQPTFVSGFSVSMDYWNVDLGNRIANIGANQDITNCYNLLIKGQVVAGGQQSCDAIVRTINGLVPSATNPQVAVTAAGIIYKVNLAPINYVASTTRGIDIESSYRFHLDDIVASVPGNIGIHVATTHYLKNYTNDGISVPTNTAGAQLPSWKYNVTLNYDNGPIRASLTGRGFTSGKRDNSWIECNSGCPLSTSAARTIAVGQNYQPGALYFDTAISYAFGLGDGGQIETFFNVKNVFNKDPGIVPGLSSGTYYTAPPTIKDLYDMQGRVYKAGIRVKM